MFGGQPHTEIAGRERVGIPEPPHGDHLGTPWADAGQRQQLHTGRRPVAAGVEDELTVQVPLDDRTTLYSRWGDWLGLSCLAIAIGWIPMGLLRRNRA